MSYILDALKKADHERTIGEVPDLEAPHWGERHSERSYHWVWGVVALLVVNGILLALLVGRDAANEDAPVEAPSDTAGAMPVKPQPRTRNRLVETPRMPVSPREDVPVQPAPVAPSAVPASRSPAPVTTPASAPAVPRQTRGSAKDVPAWDELPLELRSRFSLPRLDVHVYAEEPQRRFIMVDLQKYREGDTLDNGAVLEEILPDSIQLNYEGTRFRMEK